MKMLQETKETTWQWLSDAKERLLRIAEGVIRLSKTAPFLQKLSSGVAKEAHAVQEKAEELDDAVQEVANLGHQMAEEAEEADLASQKAQSANRHSKELVFAVKGQMNAIVNAMDILNAEMHQLSESSQSIESLMDIIRTIALQTRLLSLNASVEAARSGHAGKGFSVIANEIRALSEQTQEAVRQASQTLNQANKNVSAAQNSAQTVGTEVKEGVQTATTLAEHFEKAEATLISLVQHVQSIARLAKRQDERLSSTVGAVERVLQAGRTQAQSATDMDKLAKEVDQTSETLLSEVGRFRLPIHDKSKAVLESFVQHWKEGMLERLNADNLLESFAKAHPYFELLYVTDNRGIQMTDNVSPEGRVQAAYGTTGLGENWSSRPWFKFVRDHQETYISDLYRSAATNNFCFTVATPIFSPQRKFLGVLAADIHFDRLLSA